VERETQLARLRSGRPESVASAGDPCGHPRLIVSPTAGTFVPRLHPSALAGTAVRVGDSVGHVTSMGGEVAVCSQFDGELVELLAHPGERVRRHQPIGWLTTADVEGQSADAVGTQEGLTGIPGVVMSGANGFVGSHLLVAWLWANRHGRAACVVRGKSPAAARARLIDALRIAAAEAALPIEVDDLVGDRLLVVDSELIDARDLADVLRPWAAGLSSVDVLHVAADLSFKQSDRPRVWRANVHGSASMVDLAAQLAHPQLTFSHISTAYVCGGTQGAVREELATVAPPFANPYEESKFHAEAMVRNSATAYGIPWRILRPSIVIGHSATLQASAGTGLYKVVGELHALSQLLPPELRTVVLPLGESATIDLIPVDVVVDEVLSVIAAGETSTGQVFHVTADRPLPLATMFERAAPVLGVHVVAGGPPADEQLAKLSRAVARRVRHYLPYLQSNRRFERGNVARFVDHGHRQLSVERAIEFIECFITELSIAEPVALGATA
jgi:thioester reductase-like protein